MALTPAQRRQRRAERRREEREREQRQKRREEREKNKRREVRQRVNELGLLTPKERRERIDKIQRGGVEGAKERTRLSRLRQSRETQNAKAVRNLMDLTPLERAKRIRHIEASERLNQKQEAIRIARLRASGRVGKLPKRPKDGSVNNPRPLPGDKGERFEDLLQGEQLNAFNMIMLDFERLGLGRDLAKEVYNAIVNGITNVDMILDLVRQSNVYQKRFPGMAKRDPNLPPLSEAEYIDIEKQYRWVMETAGLPQGFYDSPQDFADFIGNDMGPQEFQGRVDLAARAARSVDPTQRQLLADFYGIGQGDLTAHFLDSKRALPILQRQVEASGVAFYADRAFGDQPNALSEDRGLNYYFGLVSDFGVTEDEARQQYGAIAQTKKSLDEFDYIYGEQYSRRDAELDAFVGDPSSAFKRERLVANERANWSGRSRGMTGRGNRSLSY